ncbi:MAG: hypothetical protein ACYDHW_12735 [Syntrophorhabdaceae bacterium]
MSAEMIVKMAKVFIPVIIGAIIGGFIVGKILEARINAQEIDLAKVRQELTTKEKELTDCQDANKTNQTTIGSMKTEMQSVQASCTTRLRQKERTVSEIKRIDSLKPGVKTNATDSNTAGSITGDPILDDLNRMFASDGKPADRED